MSMHVLFLHPYRTVVLLHARVHNEIPPIIGPKDSTRLEGGKRRSWRQSTWVGGAMWLTGVELARDWPVTKC